MSERKRGDPYEVGFGNPPVRTRFKKGISGNPKGRPRKKPDIYTELMAVLQGKVLVTIEDEPREVTVLQALLLRLRQEAQGGRAWAAKLVLKIIEAMPEAKGASMEEQLKAYEDRLRLQLVINEIEIPK